MRDRIILLANYALHVVAFVVFLIDRNWSAAVWVIVSAIWMTAYWRMRTAEWQEPFEHMTAHPRDGWV